MNSEVSWLSKADLALVGEVRLGSGFRPNPNMSIIIPSFCQGEGLLQCLDALNAQTYRDFEVIIVDNGGIENVHSALAQRPVKHLVMRENTMPGGGRNVGALHSHGAIVCFLDDDCLPDARLMEVFHHTLQDPKLYAMRGRVLPRSESILNYLPSPYDLGTTMCPSKLNTEAVVAILREHFTAAGGWDPRIVGHEGLCLTYALATRYGKEGMVYQPDAVIQHNVARSLRHYLTKRARFPLSRKKLFEEYPEMEAFLASYPPVPTVSRNDLPWMKQTIVRIIKKLGMIVNGPPSFLRGLLLFLFRIDPR